MAYERFPEFYITAREACGDGFGLQLKRGRHGLEWTRRYCQVPVWKRESTARRHALTLSRQLGKGWIVEVINNTAWLDTGNLPPIQDPAAFGERRVPLSITT